jgi:hypothetical protein
MVPWERGDCTCNTSATRRRSGHSYHSQTRRAWGFVRIACIVSYFARTNCRGKRGSTCIRRETPVHAEAELGPESGGSLAEDLGLGEISGKSTAGTAEVSGKVDRTSSSSWIHSHRQTTRTISICRLGPGSSSSHLAVSPPHHRLVRWIFGHSPTRLGLLFRRLTA